MKYINVQSKDRCINVYQVSIIYIKDLSIYAKINDNKVLIGSYNTKEDTYKEYNQIINALAYKSPIVYNASSEEYWIKNRIEIEIDDIFQEESDMATDDDEEEMIEYNDSTDIPGEDIFPQDIEDDYSDSVDNE